MAKTFGGYCDGCRCGFSLTTSLRFWPSAEYDDALLLCDPCETFARKIGRKRANEMIREHGEFVDFRGDAPIMDRWS